MRRAPRIASGWLLAVVRGSVGFFEVAERYDVFVSYHRANADIARPLRDALVTAGLEVFFDETEIEDFQGITSRLEAGLARCKALLAVYSATYPTRRACQFELTAAFLAAQRAGDPRARVLVVNPEDGIEHIAPAELRDALFHRLRAKDPPKTFAQVATTVVRHVERLEGLLGDIQPLAGAPWYGRRPVGSPLFVGRIMVMWELHSQLHASELRPMTGVVGPTVVQLRGIGGIGKTMLAEEYALRFAPAYPGGVFWLTAPAGLATADTRSRKTRCAERSRQVRALAISVQARVSGLKDPAKVDVAFRQELERHGEPYLWVVDDVPDGLDADELRSWLATSPLGKTLITTRSRRYDALAAVVELGALSPEEAVELLGRHRAPITAAETEELARLSDDLGRHALAIEVAGAALAVEAGATPYAEFRRRLMDPSEDELEFGGELTDALPTGHEPSIAKTLLSSIDGLGEEGTDLLRLASLLANTPIPSTLVDQVFAAADQSDQASARHRGMRARSQTQRASLADFTVDRQALIVHPLVSRAMRFADRQQQDRRERLGNAAIDVLTEEFRSESAKSTPASLELLIPHANQLSTGATLQTCALLDAGMKYQNRRFESVSELLRQEHDRKAALIREITDDPG